MARGSRHGRRQPRLARPSRKGMRTCIACRSLGPRDSFVRLVCDPSSGQLFVDRSLKAPGRGAHLCYTRQCIEMCVTRRAFARAFACPVLPVTAESIIERVVYAVDERIRDALALARRAGMTRSGAQALNNLSGLGLLVIAEDAAVDSATRFMRRAKAAGCEVVRFGTAEFLGKSQGRGLRIAIGISDPGFSESLRKEFKRRRQVLVAA